MKKYFLTGLVILLPAAVTFAVVVFLIRLFTNPFAGAVSRMIGDRNFFPDGFFFLTQTQVIEYASRVLILLFLFGFTLLLGIVTRWFFMHALIKLCDRILLRIPVVRAIYKTTRDLMKTLFGSDKHSFKQVVMIPFPRPGVYALGLIPNDTPDPCSATLGEKLVAVLVPTTPNPTTGFLLMLPEEQIIHLDMKAEDAIKYIVSCGVILPEQTTPEGS